MTYRRRAARFAEELEKLRQYRGGACEECKSKERLEWAHLEPTGLSGRGRGRADRLYDIKRNPTKYKLLCHRCHAKLDHRKAAEAPDQETVTKWVPMVVPGDPFDSAAQRQRYEEAVHEVVRYDGETVDEWAARVKATAEGLDVARLPYKEVDPDAEDAEKE